MTTAHELAQHQTEVDWWIDQLSGDPAHGHCGVDGCRDTPTVLLCFDGKSSSTCSVNATTARCAGCGGRHMGSAP